MTIATALLLTVISSGMQQAPAPPPATAAQGSEARGQQQAATGIIIAADIGGRVGIYDNERRLVVELDKPAGRQLQVALEPGAYEARLVGQGDRRARFQLSEGHQLLLALANFEDREAPRYEAPPDAVGQPPTPRYPAPPNAPAAHPVPHHARPLDSGHRIEVRFGGWADGSYSGYGEQWSYSGSAHGAFGFEYLNFIRNDIGIGVGLTSLVRADDCHDCWDSGAAQVVTSIPVIVRWYPVRRLTRSRAVEPYVTAGLGPVFGVDTTYTHDMNGDWHHDEYYSTRVGTAFGGRVGGGVDFRLGHVFTMGVGGAWNWDTGFSGDLWRAPRPNGGEFTMSFGWNFGR